MSSVTERDARVRAYLEDLERALRVLPSPQAAELMEQITAHLDEALPPGSAETTVVAALRRLGSPERVAAEARATEALDGDPREAAASTPRRRLRNRFGRRGWSVVAAGVAVVCVLSTWLGLYLTTPILTMGGSSRWWSQQDEAQSVMPATLGIQASIVPARRGQWQGFVVEVRNPSSVAQTILGVDTSDSPTGLVGMASVTDVTVGVSTYGNYTGGSSNLLGLRYTTPQTIEPGQFRFIRVLWLTDSCSQSNSAGSTGTDQLDLDVQVGWFSRVEHLALDPGWQLQFGTECLPKSALPESSG